MWIIKPGIQPAGLANYGWHFDEDGWFAARDFSPAGFGPTVRLRAQAVTTLNTSYRYKLTKVGTCLVLAQPQWKNIWGAGEWVDIAGADLHYDHIDPSFTGTVYSASFGPASGTSATRTIGAVATSYPCLFGSPHLHQSADVGPASLMVGDGYSGDTCWALVGWEYMCSPQGYAWTWGQHLYCPDGVYWTWVTYSGHIWGEYDCETWSLQFFDVNAAVFSLWY